MKDLMKIGLLAITISIFASGCAGCGDRTKPVEDTGKPIVDSPKKTIDAPKSKVDTAKKDTSKK